MRLDSPFIEDISRRWYDHVVSWKEHAPGLADERFNCYIPHLALAGLSDAVVPVQYATIRGIQLDSITGDHSQVIQPIDNNDTRYRAWQAHLDEALKMVTLKALSTDQQMQHMDAIDPASGSHLLTAPPYIRHIIMVLDSANSIERKEAIKQLEQAKHLSAEKALIEALQHPAKDVRLYAALALKSHPNLQTQLIPNFLEVQSEEDGQGHQLAITALVEMGQDGVPDLLNALNSNNAYVRRNAIRTLEQMQMLDAEVTPNLIQALNDRDTEVRRRAVSVLGKMKVFAALPYLKHLLTDEDSIVRVNAINVLGQMNVFDTMSALINALQDKDTSVQSAATMALRKFEKNAIPELILALERNDINLRCKVIGILGYMKSVEAIPRLMGMLCDQDARLRYSVIEALGQIGAVDATKNIICALTDEDANVRSSAAIALGRFKSVEAVPGLVILLNDEYIIARMQAAQSLGLIQDDRAVPNLRDALRDEETEVRGRATLALGRIGGSSAIQALKEALYDKDEMVYRTAVEALRHIGTAEALEILRMHQSSR